MKRLLPALALAATALIPHHAHATGRGAVWYSCREKLDFKTERHVVRSHCWTHHIHGKHTRQIGWWRRVQRLSPHVVRTVRYPRFAPLYALPGCPAAIARWASYIIPSAHRYGVAVPVMTGVMARESGGDPGALNPSGAAGLYQFLPETAARFGINPYDPYQATWAAARYLSMVGVAGFSGGNYGTAWGCD